MQSSSSKAEKEKDATPMANASKPRSSKKTAEAARQTVVELTNKITLMSEQIARLETELEQQRQENERLRHSRAKYKRAAKEQQKQLCNCLSSPVVARKEEPPTSATTAANSTVGQQDARPVQPQQSTGSSTTTATTTTTTATIAEDDARPVQSASSSTNATAAATARITPYIAAAAARPFRFKRFRRAKADPAKMKRQRTMPAGCLALAIVTSDGKENAWSRAMREQSKLKTCCSNRRKINCILIVLTHAHHASRKRGQRACWPPARLVTGAHRA